MANKIMTVFNQHIDKPTPKKFDAAVANLIKSGELWLRTLLKPAETAAIPTKPKPEILDDAEFWDQPRKGTIFVDVDKETVYQFVLKLLEGREVWVDEAAAEQIISQTPRQGETAQAVHSFSQTVLIAAAARPDIAGSLAVSMSSLMANQVEDDISEAEADFEFEAEPSPDPGSEPDLSEDELGVRTGETLENTEESDALYVLTRKNENKSVTVKYFIGTDLAGKIMADRAPTLAGLLDGSHLPENPYEYTLEKHLIARDHGSGELDVKKEVERRANREQALDGYHQDDDSRLLADRLDSVAASLMTGTGWMTFDQGEEYMDEDMEMFGDEMDCDME